MTMKKIVRESKENRISQQKVPIIKAAHVGIEVEFYSKDDRDILIGKLIDADLQDYLTVDSDGSIDPPLDNYAHEVKIIGTEDEVCDIVHRTCAVLATGYAGVNHSCGLHVHLDMRNRDPDVVYNNLVQSQHLLFAMQPKSRQDGHFCKKNNSKKFNVAMGRYHAFNASAYPEFGTIEVRLHAGTINPEKICNWIKLLVRIASRNTKCAHKIMTFRNFQKQFEVEDEVMVYVADRIKKFNVKQGEEKNV